MAEETQEEIRRGGYRRYSPVKRTRTIGVRLTDEEYSQIRQAAQRDVLNSGATFVPHVIALESVLHQFRLTISDVDDLVGRLVGRRVHCRSCQNPHCHGARPQFQTAEGDQETASSDFDEDEPGYEDWYE